MTHFVTRFEAMSESEECNPGSLQDSLDSSAVGTTHVYLRPYNCITCTDSVSLYIF